MKIESLNKKLKVSHETLCKANARLLQVQNHAVNKPNDEKIATDLAKTVRARENAEMAYVKALEGSKDAVGTGSGRVMLLLPAGSACRTLSR